MNSFDLDQLLVQASADRDRLTFIAAIISRNTGKFHAIRMAMNITQAAITVLVSSGSAACLRDRLTKLVWGYVCPGQELSHNGCIGMTCAQSIGQEWSRHRKERYSFTGRSVYLVAANCVEGFPAEMNETFKVLGLGVRRRTTVGRVVSANVVRSARGSRGRQRAFR